MVQVMHEAGRENMPILEEKATQLMKISSNLNLN